MYQELIEEIIPKLKFKFPYEIADYAQNLYLEDYHCHKDFSNTYIADSGELLSEYVKRVKELNAKCLYSGEHGSQGNHFFVYDVAEKENLKYRHSTEAYWVKDRHEKDKTNCHMVIVAKNKTGRADINYILSMANIDGYYYRPRIDLELLLNIPRDNIIVTSACIAGWNYDDAEEIWLKVWKYFGDNFFLELQANNTSKQKELNKRIIKMSEKYGIQIIAGLDSHYIGESGRVKRDQILKYKKVSYPEEAGWYMDYPDTTTLIRRFQEQGVLSDRQILTAIMNTNVFVDECEDIKLDKSFKIPNIYKDKSYGERVKLYHNILNQAYRKEPLKSKDKINGVRYEAKQVTESGVVDYFLTNQRLVHNAITEEGGILTTTSRGSSASFITNRLLGFTTVDRFNSDIPIYPERFLTKERVLAGQMPDIDLNIAEQEPFEKSGKKLLGEHGCYPLMAVGKLKEKSAWQLYAGANDVSAHDSLQISKYLDEFEKAKKYADEDARDLIVADDFIPQEYLSLYKESKEYQSIVINLIKHPCGYILFDGDIRREIGLITAISETTKERTLVACIEGKYLDKFGYLKDDFLIVDSVHLTYKLFKSLGMEVPSFEELKEMIKEDNKTWDIYEKGITCCINQCEQIKTIPKVMKYKPKSLAELSAFIAAIRPGFASSLKIFLDRQPYSTGEDRINELLKDTAHFMLYQESIMKVLSFLGMAMDNTYSVIKSISKKEYKDNPEKLAELKKELIKSWRKEIGNVNNFETVWKIIEDSAFYAFNSPHAYSMGGDSAYQAWVKGHYPFTFYEVAINHYQDKGKKDKIDSLVKECIKHYSVRLGGYEFGKDNRRVTIDRAAKVIYPSLSSVKNFGIKVVSELYEIGKYEYSSFVEILSAIESTSVNSSRVEDLIRIEYFKNFGDVNTLLATKKYYDLLIAAKQLSKKKITENGIAEDIVKKYGNETKTLYNQLNNTGLLEELIKGVEYKPLSLKDKLDNEHRILGILSTTEPNASKLLYYVSGLEVLKSITNIKLYEIYSGKTRDLKMWTNAFNRHPFEEMDILIISSCEKKHKKEPTGEINPQTGKKIYADVPDKFEFWLQKYKVKRTENEEDQELLY